MLHVVYRPLAKNLGQIFSHVDLYRPSKSVQLQYDLIYFVALNWSQLVEYWQYQGDALSLSTQKQ